MAEIGMIAATAVAFARICWPLGIRYRRETLLLEDGATVGFDWAGDEGGRDSAGSTREASETRPILVLCHGLNGSR